MKKMKNEVEEYEADFDGVFRFTNNDDEDFITLWNNKEYTYPAGQTVPMIIANESLENIQQIRKYFAERLAEKRFYKTKNFKEARNGVKDKDMGRNVVATSFDKKLLQPYIDECLKPLPAGKQQVHQIPNEDRNIKVSKSFSTGDPSNLYPSVDLGREFEKENEAMLPKS
jgi:hypothetical protein